ncbi:MAG: PepSY domain-containing protein [Rhodospirillales bacterium]|nr:PepSY domain-containing protein [Rhodospirillales bacterium]
MRDQLGGEVVGVELDRQDGRYVYEFKVITSAGRLREIYVDALTAELLKSEDD